RSVVEAFVDLVPAQLEELVVALCIEFSNFRPKLFNELACRTTLRFLRLYPIFDDGLGRGLELNHLLFGKVIGDNSRGFQILSAQGSDAVEINLSLSMIEALQPELEQLLQVFRKSV